MFCTQQSLAGSGNSTPIAEEAENSKKTTRRFIPAHNRDDDGDAIIAGLAALTIAGGTAAYFLHQALKELEPRFNAVSLDFEEIALGKTFARVVSRTNSHQPEDAFLYQNENFFTEAWKKENGLSNNFFVDKKDYKTKAYYLPNVISSFQLNEKYDFSQGIPHTYNGCPVIDLSSYEEDILEGALRIDLHPVYNKNPRKHLREAIFKRQIAYERSETEDGKIYIITGTGKKRTGPNFRLQNTVDEWLQEEYCSRRISEYKLEQEGFFMILLRKTKK